MRIRRMIASDRAQSAGRLGCLAYGKGAAATDPRRQPWPPGGKWGGTVER